MPLTNEPQEAFWDGLVDRYRPEGKIGRGGMGVVYRAHDLKHDRDVAIKVLLPELSTALGAERFLREVRVAAGLQHPHILPIYDSGEQQGYLYYVMPLVTGQTLRDRLTRETQLPIEEALRITKEVAHALSYAHRRDIVHRDIKPENILFSDGYAVVADFGIAKALSEAGSDQLTDSGLAVGTPAYMSPEQISHRGNIDGRTDLYALGCVLYEMLLGQPPFTGATPRAIMARHMVDGVPPIRTVRATVPDFIEHAVERSLAKVPADRFASGTELIAALSARDVSHVRSAEEEGSFFHELKRRRVFNAAIIYVTLGFGSAEAADYMFPVLGLPRWSEVAVVWLALLGLPITLWIAWRYDVTREGLKRTTSWPPVKRPTTQPGSVPDSPAGTGPVTGPAQPGYTPTPEHPRFTPVALPIPPFGKGIRPSMLERMLPMLDSRAGLTALLALAFFVNWAETSLETFFWGNSTLVIDLRHEAAHAAHWLERYLSFELHDVTNDIATVGYTSVYFFAFPILIIGVGAALVRRPHIEAYRMFSLTILLNYLISLPFFILFPVPERWWYSESEAVLLSDKLSATLIEAFRPLSGLDNSFPSFHVSLTVGLVLLCFVFRFRYRWAILPIGIAIVLSTFALGIHWITDILAGAATGVLAVMMAILIERRIRFLRTIVPRAVTPPPTSFALGGAT